jgi:hypothetical protein
MRKAATAHSVVIPEIEYNFLLEVLNTVKRQKFLLRLDEAERNLKAGRVKKMSVEKFLASL